ncbi:MAG: bacterioferritin-associated ferredoxin [Reinekea sp.]|nr:bacterioferritin-associated ferredoxin [Reinekea sp.]
MYVCLCQGVTDSQIRQAVSEGATSLREVNMRLGTASQCGKCGMTTRDIVNQALAQNSHTTELFYKAS